MSLKYEEITKDIIASVFEVHNQLKARGIGEGLLINLGKAEVEFKRFVY